MLELVKLLLLVVVVYTGAQALNNTINKIDVYKDRQQQAISKIKR